MGKKKKSWETTPEERRRHLETQRRLEEIIERRLARDGMMREEALQHLANPRR